MAIPILPDFMVFLNWQELPGFGMALIILFRLFDGSFNSGLAKL